MKRITIIPDVHGRPFWRAAADACEDGPVVFLGDYLDPYYFEGVTLEDALAGFREILALKQSRPDKVTLLLGNHDCGYLYGRSLCYFRTGDARYDDIRTLFRENKDLFQLAAEFRMRGKRYVFTHAGILRGWMDLHVPGWDERNMVDMLNRLNRDALSLVYPEESSFAMALSEADPERGGTAEFGGSPVWADAERLHVAEPIAGVVQVVGHTATQFDPVLTQDVIFTDCKKVLTLSERGVLRTLDGKKCSNHYKDPFNPDLVDWDDWKRFHIDCFNRPYCRCCGSRNIFIRAGIMADHYYCRDCENDQIL